MEYSRYYLNCRFKSSDIGTEGTEWVHESTVWIFDSKSACEKVLEIMKKDGGHLGKFLYIEEFTKESP